MNHTVSDKIREVLTEEFLTKLKANEFKTKGDVLQFRLPSKNALKTNMIKIQETSHDVFVIKYFTYQPFKHIFNLIDFSADVSLENLSETLCKDLGLK